mgnify:CR=1 FL=1
MAIKKQQPATSNMNEPKTERYPLELLEIESFLAEILEDVTHPLNNPKHRDHGRYRQAYEELLEKSNRMRHEWLMMPESKKKMQE